jgi:hypothetical protein
MSAFKQFLSTDVIVSPLVVNKSFSFEGTASLNNNNIGRLIGYNVPFSSSTDLIFTQLNYLTQSTALTFNSIKQLYYTNYIPNPISGSPYVTDLNNIVLENYTGSNVYSRFYNYESTTLFQTNSYGWTSYYSSSYGFDRYFPYGANNAIYALSIPKDLFGDNINPKTFYFRIVDVDDSNNIEEYIDNGEGMLIQTLGTSTYPVVGIINYSHGTVIFANNGLVQLIDTQLVSGNNNMTCSFQSSRTIYETQYKCTIRENEFNFSLNPSLISGSTDGTVYNFVTSSYFSPYVTTVGFYNEAQELLMVAKLGQPLPTSQTTDTTILVNIDK